MVSAHFLNFPDFIFEKSINFPYVFFLDSETLRRRPPLSMLTRQCTKDYKLQNPNLVIEKGVPILISISALHHDPNYWDDPYTFNPDRFNGDSKSFVERPYFPFGAGPRNCIGLRLGKMQTKVGLVLMLQKFRFELADEHIGKDLKYSPSSVISAPISGIQLKVFHR